MSHNLDGSLIALAVEINSLDAQGDGVMVEMGRKLIEVRELLRIKNGERKGGPLDVTGKHSPLGWGGWVKENLTISRVHANACIRRATDPGKFREKQAAHGKKARSSLSCLKRYIKKIWPSLSEAERNEAIDLMLSLSGPIP